MRTSKNIIWHELIGLETEIVESKNKSSVGIKGKIVDETKNTLTIKTKISEKKAIKKDCKFNIRVGSQNIVVDGKLLVGSPEKRTKKNISKKRV